jgi:signal-transduction protein with cAMP-binding, CBS, and nucleotidyltransferase domain
MPANTSGTTAAPTVGSLMRAVTTTVEPDAHVASAAYLMKRASDSALVVTTEPQRPQSIQIITDADISQAVADGRDLNDTRIHELQLRAVEPVDPDTSVAEATERMLAAAQQHLPVVRDGSLVGLVDVVALCGALLAETRADGDGQGFRNMGG